MVKHTRKILVQSLKLLFAAGIIFWLVQSGKLNFAALKNLLSPEIAALALLLILLNLFLASERWRVLINSQGEKAKPWPIFKLSLIGIFFNFAMPGGVGGDVVKAFYFSRELHGSKVIAITSVLMDRILGLLAMVLLALLVMLYDFNHIVKIPTLLTLFYFVSAFFVSAVIGLALVFSGKIYNSGALSLVLKKLPLSAKLNKLYESMHLYGKNPMSFVKVIGLSLLSQICAITFLVLAGKTAGFPEVPVTTYFLVAPLGFMATAIPISPAGVGVGQAAFYFLFNLYIGETTEVGPTTITAYQVGMFIVSLLGAFFYLRKKDHPKISKIENLDSAV